MPGKFVRVKKRTVKDIFAKHIQPRIMAQMNTLGNNIALEARKNHTFTNRTGALESSISWTPPVIKGHRYVMTVFAGGWASAKFAFNFGKRKLSNVKRRNYRYQRGKRFAVQRGQGLYVNYAPFVERRGFSVLKNAIVKYRRMGVAIMGRALKLNGV